MHLSNDMEFCALDVGAIIEKNINGIRSILIQNRIRVDDATQNHLIEVPCGKVRKNKNIFDILKYRVKEETGLIVTEIMGQNGIYDDSNYFIQGGVPFYMCQNVEKQFPVCILFFICKAEDGEMKVESDAATDIRWVSLEHLKQMLDTKNIFFVCL